MAEPKGWIKTMYVDPPDLVFSDETDFPAAMPGLVSSLQDDPVPLEPGAEDDWRSRVKAWFDTQP